MFKPRAITISAMIEEDIVHAAEDVLFMDRIEGATL